LDKRLPALVTAFGVLVLAGGIAAWYARHDGVALLTHGLPGALTAALGALLLRGARWPRRAAFFTCSAIAALQIQGLANRWPRLWPGAPVALLALSLAFLLLKAADRRT